MNEPLSSAISRTGRTPWAVYILFSVIAYFPLFLDLDVLPLRVWDEARLAVSAYEMLHNKNFLVVHFMGKPEMWSTKPPLLIWLQAALFASIGPGELALRLPSACAALLTGWFLLRMAVRQLGSPWLGLIACCILYTSHGYVNMHVARSGDYDALLILFMSLSAWALFRWMITGNRNELMLFFFMLALGVLTKSVQALMFVPGCLIFLIIKKRFGTFLRSRWTYAGVAVFLLLVCGYYLSRESINAGYLQAVWDNELGGRYGGVLEGHKHEATWYLENLINSNFDSWYMLVPCGMVIGFLQRDARMRDWAWFLVCIGAGYLILISMAGTKINWYDAPLYPVLAGLSAIAIHSLFHWLERDSNWALTLRAPAIPYLMLFLVFARPYAEMIHRVYLPTEMPSEVEFYRPGHYLKDATRGVRALQADALCYEDYNAHLLFYVWLLNDQGRAISSINKVALVAGQHPMAAEWSVKEYIESHYLYHVIEDVGSVRVYGIDGLIGKGKDRLIK